MKTPRRPTLPLPRRGEVPQRDGIEIRLAAAGLPPPPRLAWLEIDEEALEGNFAAVRSLVGRGTRVAAVVKADGYGHGLEVSARTFRAAGADMLCVATLDEALRLRAIGLDLPVLVLFPIPAWGIEDARAARLELVVSGEAHAREIVAAVGGPGSDAPEDKLRVHLEIETGLSRGGVLPERAASVANSLASSDRVRLVGIWSHLAAPEDAATTARQRERFTAAVAALDAAGHARPARHLAATGGLFCRSVPPFEVVRPGLCLYGQLGVPPAEDAGRARDVASALRPAMTLKARALRVELIPGGESVGYGGTWVAQRASIIATLPVGYGDGWVRGYAPGASALLRGGRVPLVGTVAMDAVMVDVTDADGVEQDEEFVLLGRQGEEEITVVELARLRNTIPWEVVTGMAYRVPRVYHRRSGLTGLRTLGGEWLAGPHPRDGEWSSGDDDGSVPSGDGAGSGHDAGGT